MSDPLLAIDSSGPFVFCTLRDRHGSLHTECIERKHEYSNSESIPRVISGLLKSLATPPQTIRGLIFGSGPGSFTGLRVSLSYLKGISFAHHIPLIGISSLKAIAYEFRDQSSLIVPLADAQRGEFFYAIYKGELLDEVVPPRISSLDEILKELERIQKGQADISYKVKWCGYVEGLSEHLTAKFELTNKNIEEPRSVSESLIKLSSQIRWPTYSVSSLAEIEPLYLRSVNARTIAERGVKSP